MSSYFPQYSYQPPYNYQYPYNTQPAPPVLPYTASMPNVTMPAYYVSPSGHHRSYSQSHSHSHSHQPQVIYAPSHGSHGGSGHGHSSYAYPITASHSNGAYYDTGKRRRSHSTSAGYGGQYYTMPSSGSHHHRSGTYHAPSSGHRRRRSHSASRHHTPHVIDLRNQYQQPHVMGDAGRHHDYGSQYRYSEPFGERLRRFFGIGQSGYRGNYVDARSGRNVDWRGRPIYRV
ncbi:hypothetical protein AcW1_004484 [Taiwanofungus camphoratus]|nr:hypothetical protein AcW1_004484 [Antrodia cinnamomea]